MKTDRLDIMNVDCMELMAGTPDNAYSLAICDPPYGIGINKNIGRRKHDTKKHAPKQWDNSPPPREYWVELQRVSVSQIVWGANNFSWLPPSNGWIVWDKDITGSVEFSGAELAYTNIKNTVQIFRHRAQTGGETYTNKIHPTQKPVALYRWLLANYAKPGDTILDTHMGSGSIAIACHYAGYHLTACELDADYYREACERIRRETAQQEFEL